ncbi:hypothetical protein [Streptomyces sp. NRRL F-5135]|uniref:hypothetical protein n=1 Tax=Streptomyces sp. NRRL F-5135 TaxID=1463858 RepID=UPI000B1E85F3|nr:hypothetical protein [Streptomyces sp. NRRL F-5135]
MTNAAGHQSRLTSDLSTTGARSTATTGGNPASTGSDTTLPLAGAAAGAALVARRRARSRA